MSRMSIANRRLAIATPIYELSVHPESMLQKEWKDVHRYATATPEERQEFHPRHIEYMEILYNGLTPTERLGGFLYGIYPTDITGVYLRRPEEIKVLEIRQQEEMKSAEIHAIRQLVVHRHGDLLRQHALGQIRHDIVLHLADHPKEKLTIEIVEFAVKEAIEAALVAAL